MKRIFIIICLIFTLAFVVACSDESSIQVGLEVRESEYYSQMQAEIAFLRSENERLEAEASELENQNNSIQTRRIVTPFLLEFEFAGNVMGESFPQDFIQFINENAIDRKYAQIVEEFDIWASTSYMRNFTNSYEIDWKTQMNHAYNQLLDRLDSEDRESLIDAQNGWLAYMEFSNALDYYLVQSGHLPLLAQFYYGTRRIASIRLRAIELLEILYIIDSSIELFIEIQSVEEWLQSQ